MSEPLDAVPDDVVGAAKSLLERACGTGLSLVTAESCTGGLLASLLTDVEGASGAFERGYVVYSEPAKCELLGLAQQQIDRCGAVSRDVAVAMAEGALARSHADLAIAITGFAGPAGPEDEHGLVHFGCIRRDRKAMHREEHFGEIGRGGVRVAAVRVALEMLSEQLD